MKCGRVTGEQLRLYLVTDGRWAGPGNLWSSLEEQVEAALEGGITMVQFREKGSDADRMLETAFKLKALAGKHRVPFVVNDHLEVARRVSADGVHLGQGDGSVSKARQILGPDRIVGVSVHSVKEAREAQAQGADYLGAGAVFGTGTKGDARVLSLETLQDICGAVSIPVVAIGGINRKTLSQLSGTGIEGVAVVSAVLSQSGIREAARGLRLLSEAMVSGQGGDQG